MDELFVEPVENQERAFLAECASAAMSASRVSMTVCAFMRASAGCVSVVAAARCSSMRAGHASCGAMRDAKPRSSAHGASNVRLVASSPALVEAVVLSTCNRVEVFAMVRGDADPADTCITLMAEDGGRISGMFHTMSEDDVRLVMRQPWVAIASDGSAINLDAMAHAIGAFGQALHRTGDGARQFQDAVIGPVRQTEALRMLDHHQAGIGHVHPGRVRIQRGFRLDRKGAGAPVEEDLHRPGHRPAEGSNRRLRIGP